MPGNDSNFIGGLVGLNAGAYCVKLQMNDGGPNDADGVANRVIKDPGGASVTVAVTTAAVDTSDRTISSGASNVVILRLQLTSNSGIVELHQLSLKGAGSGNDRDDIAAVKVWDDVNNNGQVDNGDNELGSGTYQTDNGSLQLQLTAPYLLTVGTTNLLVSYDF